MIKICETQYSLGINNGKNMTWRVLDDKDGRLLLLCEDIVDKQPYHSVKQAITWEQSSIRKWLNDNFLNQCFSAEELIDLCMTTIQNENNPYNGTKGGNSTEDIVFLLGINEVNKYLKRYHDRSVGPRWWLRTPGDYNHKAMYIGSDGQRQYFGYDVDYMLGVRPAIWVNCYK